MKTYVIHLERHDDVTSISDKIVWTKSSRVLLVWPRRGRVLARSLDLLIIQRVCQRIGAQLACVCDDDDILDNAKEIGIPVFQSVKVAERIPWRRQRTKKLFVPNPKFIQLKLDQFRDSLRPADRTWANSPAVRFGALLIGLVSIAMLLLVMLPQAKVILPLAVTEQIVELPVWANNDLKSVNLSGGLPATAVGVVVQGQASRSTSGSMVIPESAATGEVRFKNLTSTIIVIPEGTIVQTLAEPPVQFKTGREVTLNSRPGDYIDCPVKAVQAGIRGNVAVGAVKAVVGRLGASVAVENRYSMIGGSDISGKTATRDDIDQLLSQLTESLRDSARRQLINQMAPGDRFLDPTFKRVKIEDEKIEPPMGLPSDQVSLNVQIEFQAWTIRESDLDLIARTGLEAGRPAGTTVLAESFQRIDVGQPQMQEGQLAWKIRARQLLQANWEGKVLLSMIVGQAIHKARAALSNLPGLVGAPELVVTPGWWPVVPLLPARIQVEVR